MREVLYTYRWHLIGAAVGVPALLVLEHLHTGPAWLWMVLGILAAPGIVLVMAGGVGLVLWGFGELIVLVFGETSRKRKD